MLQETLIGSKYGRLTVVEYLGKVGKQYKWRCVCECGNSIAATATHLKSGHTKSCGCYQREIAVNNGKAEKHGGTGTRLYGIWAGMKTRCYNPRSDHYEDYMGRGITICDEWRYDFAAFRDWALANGYRDDLTIDRIDPNGNYCPENCRWETTPNQNRNKTTTVIVEFQGQMLPLKEVAAMTGQKYATLFWRYKQGWPTQEIIHGRKPKNLAPDI